MLNVTASEDTPVSVSSDNPLVLQAPSVVIVKDGARAGTFLLSRDASTETTPPTVSIADLGGLVHGTKTCGEEIKES